MSPIDTITCRTKEGDECYTPFYAVDVLKDYVEKFSGKTIWCPFDKEWSAYVQSLKEWGFDVIYSHLDDGKDFFEYEPENWDLIISNPPFSIRDKILKRCYEFGKPFCLLLPVKSLQGIKRFELFKKYGLEIIVLDGRVDFHTNGNMETYTKGNSFGSMYFCKDFLPTKMEFRQIKKYEKSLNIYS